MSEARIFELDEVEVYGIGFGTVRRIRQDDRGDEIYTVELDENGELVYARRCELIHEGRVKHGKFVYRFGSAV